MTVTGPVSSKDMGVSLIHEHILVGFFSSDSMDERKWDVNKVISRALPFLQEIKELGCQTFVECTPAYLSRDPLLLQSLSEASGLNFITNTGLYGSGNNRSLPDYALSETADQLAKRWTAEWNTGIGSTGIKPGFIKIAVGVGHLSDIHSKLVTAAAKTHLETGLTIMSHTGPAIPAFEQIDVLKKEGVSPEAFIWTHAQDAAGEPESHIRAAQAGAWVSLDGIGEGNVYKYADMIQNMKDNSLLHKVLISHDAGWYDPTQENGGNFRGFSTIFKKLIPLLKERQFSDADIRQLLVINPAEAFEVKNRKINE
jgi:phosphotriesterase-related protein